MTAPILIARAPYESTMGLVQKIFYFHMPPGHADARCRLSSAASSACCSSIKKRPVFDWIAFAAAELTVLYGAMAMVTGPLWARKAWGVWWQWDARLTMSLLLWMVFVSYLLLRRYGGPGSETLAAGLALFGMATVAVRVSLRQHLANHAPADVGRADTCRSTSRLPLWYAFLGFLLLYIALMTHARADRRAARAARSALSRERGMRTRMLPDSDAAE